MNYPFVILTGYILSDKFQGYHDSDIDVQYLFVTQATLHMISIKLLLITMLICSIYFDILTSYTLREKFESSHDSAVDVNYLFVIFIGYSLNVKFQGSHVDDVYV